MLMRTRLRHPLALWVLSWCLWAGLVQAAEYPASLHWQQRAELGFQVSGVIDQVPVTAGQVVNAGDVLLSLDDRAFKAPLAARQADLDRVQQALGEARRELDRVTELYDRMVIATTELEQAKLAEAMADAEVRAAQAKLEHARLNLEYATLRAPFAGRVVSLSAANGQSVVSSLQSVPMVVVAGTRRMLARAEVSFEVLEGLKDGQPAKVTVNGKTYQGKIIQRGLEPVAGDGTPRYALEVVFDTGGALLRAGQPASLVLP